MRATKAKKALSSLLLYGRYALHGGSSVDVPLLHAHVERLPERTWRGGPCSARSALSPFADVAATPRRRETSHRAAPCAREARDRRAMEFSVILVSLPVVPVTPLVSPAAPPATPPRPRPCSGQGGQGAPGCRSGESRSGEPSAPSGEDSEETTQLRLHPGLLRRRPPRDPQQALAASRRPVGQGRGRLGCGANTAGL